MIQSYGNQAITSDAKKSMGKQYHQINRKVSKHAEKKNEKKDRHENGIW